MNNISTGLTDLASLLTEWSKMERPNRGELPHHFRQRVFALLAYPEQINIDGYPGAQMLKKLLSNEDLTDAYKEQYQLRVENIMKILERDASLLLDYRVNKAEQNMRKRRAEKAFFYQTSIPYWEKLKMREDQDYIENGLSLLGNISGRGVSQGGILAEKFPALQYRLRKLCSYAKAYTKSGYICTPSRENYEDSITDALLDGASILLTGETGTGKTFMAKRVMRDLDNQKRSFLTSFEGMELQISGADFNQIVAGNDALHKKMNSIIDQATEFFREHPEGTYKDFIDSISISLNEVSGHSGMTVGELAAKSSLRPSGKQGAMEMITVLGPVLRGAAEGRPILIDEIDLIPTDTIMRIKSLMTARPNDSYTPQEGLGKTYKIRGVQIIATRNGKSARHDRIEMDPAIERLFTKKIRITYPDIQEQYDMILAELIDPKTGTITGVTEKELSNQNGIVCAFLRAVELIREDYTMWDYAHGLEEKSKRIKNAVIDPGIIASWIRGFKLQHELNLTEYLKNHMIEFLCNAPAHDQANIAKIMTQFGILFAEDFANIRSKLLGISNHSLSEKNNKLIDEVLKKWGFHGFLENSLLSPGSVDIFFIDPYSVASLDPFNTFEFEKKIVTNDDDKLLEYILDACSGVFLEDDNSTTKQLILSLVSTPEKIESITQEDINLIDQYLEHNNISARDQFYGFSKTKKLKPISGVHTNTPVKTKHPFLVDLRTHHKEELFQLMRERGIDDPSVIQKASIIRSLDGCIIGRLGDILPNISIPNQKISRFKELFSQIHDAKVLIFRTTNGDEHMWLLGTHVISDIGEPKAKQTIQSYIISPTNRGSYGSYQGWQQLFGDNFSDDIISSGDIKILTDIFAGDQTIVCQLLSQLISQKGYYNPHTSAIKETNKCTEFWLSDNTNKDEAIYISLMQDALEQKKGGKFMGRPIVIKVF